MASSNWRDGIIVLLYQGKGARTDCCNHRPITLLSVPDKILAHILLARIELLLTENCESQSGFTSCQLTVDAIVALRLLSDIRREFQQPLHVANVDLKSAFD